MEHLEAARAGGAGEGAGLARREVVALAGLVQVGVEERRLAEEDVGSPGKPDDPCGVRRREERVDDVGDLLSVVRD